MRYYRTFAICKRLNAGRYTLANIYWKFRLPAVVSSSLVSKLGREILNQSQALTSHFNTVVLLTSYTKGLLTS